MEKPYVPFYKPYGMTDEEYEYEVMKAEQRLAEWELEQEQIKISSNTVLADSTPSQECYKTGEPCRYGCSGLCKESC